MIPRDARRPVRSGGFILFEAMLAVAIFAIGVLALGRCVEGCIQAGTLKEEDARARRVLENRMAEIEAGAVQMVKDSTTDELKGAFAGMTLKQTRVALKRKNEKEQEILGIYAVTLEVAWKSSGAAESRTLQFYVFPKQQ